MCYFFYRNCLNDASSYKKIYRFKRRRGTIINFAIFLLFITLFLTAVIYGFIEIHFERIYKVNDDGSLNSQDSVVALQRRLLNDKSVIRDLENLFKLVEQNRMAIKKQLEYDELKRIIQLHENEVRLEAERAELRKKNAETATDKDRNDEDEESDEYDDDESLRNTTLFVDRNLMIKYLKVEKYILNKRRKSLYTVKDVVSANFDLNELPVIWKIYNDKISEIELPSDPAVVNKTLDIMLKKPIINCREKERGTQIKIIATFEDETQAMIKPMRYGRDYETPPDHFYFVDFERHHAEIAAYHLDRLLNFNRVPPTVGRVFNMTSDLWEKADEELGKTFFYSPAGNVCFTGHCSYYCDTTHAICGRPYDKLEGSVQLMLPRKPYMSWIAIKNPYRRTYNKRKKAEWETNDNFCVSNVFQDIYFQSKHLLDLIDMTIFDFLTGNMDRHHYEQLKGLGNYTFNLHLDNGRSFGKVMIDEMSILAPLKQCCLVRYSTFLRLKELHEKRLSKLMNESLKADPLYPILTDGHLNALDRRLVKIFLEIYNCVVKFSVLQTVVDDGY